MKIFNLKKIFNIKKIIRILALPIILLIGGLATEYIYPLEKTLYLPEIVLFIVILSILLLTYNLLIEVCAGIARSNFISNSRIARHIFELVKNSLRVFFILIAINIYVYSANLPAFYARLTNKVIYGILILLAGWVFTQLLKIGEIWSQHRLEKNDIDASYLTAQFTKIKMIRQVLNYLVIIVTIAAILMLFDQARTIGISLIASAGLLSAILGFAAQKPLASIFTGIQLAFSQPVKMGDIVIIEGEYGTIEEITMSYAVVKIWDARRIVVPLNYFFDRPIQNWSYRKENLLGTVFFYVDYSAPVAILREEVEKMVKAAPFWDGNVWNLQVTNLSSDSMELRVTVSAVDPGNLWNLRVFIREKLITFINKEYPGSFPKKRLLMHQN